MRKMGRRKELPAAQPCLCQPPFTGGAWIYRVKECLALSCSRRSGTPSAGAALAPDFIQQETENILSLLFINFKPIISDQMPLVNPAAAKARKSELCVAHSAGVGKDIPDVADAGEVHHQPLKTKAESGVTAGAVTPQVAVLPVVLRLHAQLLDAALQHFQPLLTLAAADDFPDAGH